MPSTNCGEDRLVSADGDHAEPVAEVLQESSVGNVVDLFVAEQKNLGNLAIAWGEEECLSVQYFDIAMRFAEHCLEEHRHVQCAQKAGVQRVKVVLQGDASNDEILCHPFPKVLVVAQDLFQFLGLLGEVGEGEVVEGEGDFVVDMLGGLFDTHGTVTGIAEERSNIGILGE